MNSSDVEVNVPKSYNSLNNPKGSALHKKVEYIISKATSGEINSMDDWDIKYSGYYPGLTKEDPSLNYSMMIFGNYLEGKKELMVWLLKDSQNRVSVRSKKVKRGDTHSKLNPKNVKLPVFFDESSEVYKEFSDLQKELFPS
jgi:hypothetical protein